MEELVKMIAIAQERVQSIQSSVTEMAASADQLLCEAKLHNAQEFPESPEAVKQDIHNLIGIIDEVSKSELFKANNVAQNNGTPSSGSDFVSKRTLLTKQQKF